MVCNSQASPTFGDQVIYNWAPGTQYKAFAGDFDGDGLMDIGLWHSIDWIFFIKHGPSFTDQVSYQWAAGDQYEPFAADFNGDSKADIGLRHTIDGEMFWKTGPTFNDQSSYAWVSGANTSPSPPTSAATIEPISGCGRSRMAGALSGSRPASPSSARSSGAGGVQYQAFAADFDADDKAEIGLRHSVDGLLVMRPGPDFVGQFSFRTKGAAL